MCPRQLVGLAVANIVKCHNKLLAVEESAGKRCSECGATTGLQFPTASTVGLQLLLTGDVSTPATCVPDTISNKRYVHHHTETSRAQELNESRGGRPGLPDPNKPDGFCGRKATLKRNRRARILVVEFSKSR